MALIKTIDDLIRHLKSMEGEGHLPSSLYDRLKPEFGWHLIPCRIFEALDSIRAKRPSNALTLMGTWNTSPQGDDFWRKQHRLLSAGRTSELDPKVEEILSSYANWLIQEMARAYGIEGTEMSESKKYGKPVYLWKVTFYDAIKKTPEEGQTISGEATVVYKVSNRSEKRLEMQVAAEHKLDILDKHEIFCEKLRQVSPDGGDHY